MKSKKEDVHKELSKQLKGKKVSKSELWHINKELESYLLKLQKKIKFSLDTSLKKFIQARR